MKSNTLKSLLNDEHGMIVSAELVIISTLVVAGLTVGLGCLRESLVGEFQDVSCAIGSLNQSYCYGGVAVRKGCCTAYTAGSAFVDYEDAVAVRPFHSTPRCVEQLPAIVPAAPVEAPCEDVTPPVETTCPVETECRAVFEGTIRLDCPPSSQCEQVDIPTVTAPIAIPETSVPLTPLTIPDTPQK